MTFLRLGRTIRRLVRVAIGRAWQDYRSVWWVNPGQLVRFAGHLLAAMAAWGTREQFPTPLEVGRQVVKSFVRGVLVTIALGVVLGLGLGSVANRFGVVIMPLLEQTVVVALVRDGAPLLLAVLLTARMGSSIAASLADERQTPLPSGSVRFGDREILHLVLPHLAAGVITGWAFYQIGIFLLIPGYLSLGEFGAFLDGLVNSAFVPVDRELVLSAARASGALKSALFGGIVAYTAAVVGLSTNERLKSKDRYIHSERRRAEAIQDAVWGSGVTGLTLITIVAVLFWLLQGNLS